MPPDLCFLLDLGLGRIPSRHSGAVSGSPLLIFLLSLVALSLISILHDFTSQTTKGTFSIHMKNDWAPLGAARFLELVDVGFFTGSKCIASIHGLGSLYNKQQDVYCFYCVDRFYSFQI
jgi:hypothetical protein